MHMPPLVGKSTRGSAGALGPSAYCTFHRARDTGHAWHFHMRRLVGERTRGSAGALGPSVYSDTSAYMKETHAEMEEAHGLGHAASMGQLWDNYGTTMGQPMGQPMGQFIFL